MKKILLIILALFMGSAVCSAEFNPPNPERWELFKDTGNILCYFNKEAVEITEQPYGRSAKVWVTTYDVTIKIEAMMDWELNLDREEWRMLTGNIYDEEGNELLATANPEEFKAIPKGSVIEDLYRELGGKEKPAEEPAAEEADKKDAAPEGEAKDEDVNKGETETPAAEEAKEADKAEQTAPEKAEGADAEKEKTAAPEEPAAPAPEAEAVPDEDVNRGEPAAEPAEPAAPAPEAEAAPDRDINQGEDAAAPEAEAAPDRDINQGEPAAAETAETPAAAPGEIGVEV